MRLPFRQPDSRTLAELQAAAPGWSCVSAPDNNLLERCAGWPELKRQLGGNASPATLTGPEILETIAIIEQGVVQNPAADQHMLDWFGMLKTAATSTKAGEWAARSDALIRRIVALEKAMDFRILYNGARHLFSIGYNESAGRLDNSHYDLLASEACLTSFLAVARGEVPRKHWFQLSRVWHGGASAWCPGAAPCSNT